MTYIKTTSPQDATGQVLDLYERQQEGWGYVPNYSKLFSHRPEVMEQWSRLLAEIRRPVDARRFELVTFAAANELGNSSCALAHGKQLTQFFSDEDIRAIARHETPESLSAAEVEMIAFARKVAGKASNITSDDVDALKRHGLSDAEIFDVVATAAARSFLTKILDGLGCQPDAEFASIGARLPESLAVGRPIDTTPVEYVPGSDTAA